MRKTQSPLLTAYEDYRLATAQHSWGTQRWSVQKLGVFLAYCTENGLDDLEDVKAADVRRFLAKLAEESPSGRTLSSYTLHGYAQVVKGFFSWCAKDGLLDNNHVANVRMPRVDVKIIQTFSQEQVSRLFAAAKKGRHPLRDTAILATLFDTGIRAAELCGLQLAHTHITPSDSYIQVFGKGRKERQCPLGPTARMAMHRYMTRERPPTNLTTTFVAKGDKPLKVRGLESLFDRLGELADIAGPVRCSPHDARHTFAATYMRAGGNIHTLSKLLGHTSVTTTECYLRSFGAEDARNNAGISVLDAIWR